VAPSGLYTRLYHAFSSLVFYYEQSYLSIYWTDFHDLFTKWKVFACIFLTRSSFSNSSRNIALTTNFISYHTFSVAEVSQDPLDRFTQSLLRMVGIELQMINLIFFFRYLKGRCHGNQLKVKKLAFFTNQYILSCCHSERDCKIAIPISKGYI